MGEGSKKTSKYSVVPLTPKGIQTYSLHSRKSKVNISQFAQSCSSGASLQEFIDKLPDILAGKDFKEFIAKLKQAKEAKKPIIFAGGAHFIKVGLNPVMIDLMKKGWVSALALNGAAIIHDFEVAFSGQTSEDVAVQIKNGRFGMAQETGEILNKAICTGGREGLGLGEAVGKKIAASRFPYRNLSILAAAYELNIPVTVHVAIGTDIIHFHPGVDGESLGKTSLRDFFLFCALVEKLEGGGVFINVGSAVVLPEVFLKAVSLCRSRGSQLEEFTTAVFDFIHQYRPFQNVVKKPLGEKGKGYYFIGHHEILIPLLAASIIS